MKKLFLLTVCCLILFTGCGKKEEENDWTKNFQASNLKWEDSGNLIYAVGNIKNTSGKKCKSIEINLTYKREDFERHQVCLEWPDFEDGESFKAKCLYKEDSQDLIKNYSIKIDSIKCRDEDLK